jgi:hypothetical protein
MRVLGKGHVVWWRGLGLLPGAFRGCSVDTGYPETVVEFQLPWYLIFNSEPGGFPLSTYDGSMNISGTITSS